MYIPYIGITDFIDFKQVKHMSSVFKENKSKGSLRQLHVGVMMSYKTLHGLPTKWAAAFPVKERIQDIFGYDRVYNCLHYADYDRDPDLVNSLSKAIWYGGIGIHAIQLDMVWPEPGSVANAVHASRKQLEVILQIGKKAIEECEGDPALIAERLGDYEGVVDRVLLDKSMGKGLGMDAEALRPIARAIRERFPTLGLVVAGGLGPHTMDLVRPLVREFPDLSIDAQGKLRPSGNALDPIDWDLASAYLVKALALWD